MLKPSQRGHISHIKPKPHSAIWRMQIQPKPQTKWIVLKCISRWIVMNEVQNTYKEIFIFQKEPVHLISLKTRFGNRETTERETISFYNRNTSHSDECFPPTEHKAFFLKASTILVSLRIAEARHVNHLLRVTQYNMVLSAL